MNWDKLLFGLAIFTGPLVFVFLMFKDIWKKRRVSNCLYKCRETGKLYKPTYVVPRYVDLEELFFTPTGNEMEQLIRIIRHTIPKIVWYDNIDDQFIRINKKNEKEEVALYLLSTLD